MKHLFFLMAFVFSSAFAQERDFCSEVKLSESKFEKQKIWRTPLLEPLSFSKVGDKIYLSLKTRVYSPGIKEKGVVLLLSDNTKMSFPNEDVSYSYTEGYYATAFILLSKKNIDRLIKAYITDFKLYVHEQELLKAYDYYEYYICLLNK